MSYEETRREICKALLDGLKSEDNSSNRTLLFWTCISFLYENVEYSEVKTLAHEILTVIVTNVTYQAKWSESDCLLALDAASEIAFFAREVISYDKNSASFFVSNMTQLIQFSMQKEKSPTLKDKIVVSAFQVIADWMMLDNFPQWIMLEENYPTFKHLCEVIGNRKSWSSILTKKKPGLQF